mgnify:FL=1|jgi:hypothetical protein
MKEVKRAAEHYLHKPLDLLLDIFCVVAIFGMTFVIAIIGTALGGA